MGDGQIAIKLGADIPPNMRPSEGGSDRPSRRAQLKAGSMRREGVAKVLPDVFELKGQNMSEKVKTILKQYDVNEDDQLDVAEVTALVEHLMAEERQNQQLKWAVIFLSIFTCILLAGMFGLTWAVVWAIKDTKVDKDSGVLTVKGDTSKVVQVASYEYTVNGGVLNQRRDGMATIGNTTVTNPVRSGQYQGVRLSYSPLLGSDTLMEMNYLVIAAGSGINASELLVKVHGVARLIDLDSRWGSVVKIVTPLGTISLYDKDDIRFDSTTANIFEEMGLVTTNVTGGAGRRLMQDGGARRGRADALFNTVDENDVIDPSVYDYRSVGDNKGQAKSKAQKAFQAYQKAIAGNAGAEAALAAAWSEWKNNYYTGGDTDTIDAVRGKDQGMRYSTFKANLKQVLETNTDDGKSWVSNGNAFMDTDLEELKNLFKLGDNAQIAEQLRNEHSQRSDTAGAGRKLLQTGTYVNWWDKGKITAVRTQGGCGCCWAFSAIAAVESAFLIQYNLGPTGVRLSHGQVAFCCAKGAAAAIGTCGSGGGCGGGSAGDAIDYAWKSGIADEATTWNVDRLTWGNGATVACNTGVFPSNMAQAAQKQVKLSQGFVWGGGQSQANLMNLVNDGPVVVYIEVASDLYFFGAGVYDGVCGTSVNHGVLLIGYDRRGAIPYWIIKNSWGTSWGGKASTTTGLSWTATNGYMWLRQTGDGPGKCGVHLYAYQVKRSFSNAYGYTPNAVGR